MSKLVNDFLKEVKEKKIEQLMGIALDLRYWHKVVGKDDEDELRKQLEEENNKRVVNKNGTIFKDERDMDKINALNNRINEITKAKEEMLRLKGMEKGIKMYLGFVDKPDKTTTDELESIAKL